jgi:hypothetical protein
VPFDTFYLFHHLLQPKNFYPKQFHPSTPTYMNRWLSFSRCMFSMTSFLRLLFRPVVHSFNPRSIAIVSNCELEVNWIHQQQFSAYVVVVTCQFDVTIGIPVRKTNSREFKLRQFRVRFIHYLRHKIIQQIVSGGALKCR